MRRPTACARAFVDKPDRATAEAYVDQIYLWNIGNFAFEAEVLMGELDAFEPRVSATARARVAARDLQDGLSRMDKAALGQAAKISLDCKVMERTRKAAVASATFSWSDLGAWDAIWEACPKIERDNAVSGDVTLIDCARVFARWAVPFIGVISLSDIILVADPDAVLVCHRDASNAVKTLVDGLKRDGRAIANGCERVGPRRLLSTTATTSHNQPTTAKASIAAMLLMTSCL